jgi:hypothetical protein
LQHSKMEQLQRRLTLQHSKIDAMLEVVKELLNQLGPNVFGKTLDNRGKQGSKGKKNASRTK